MAKPTPPPNPLHDFLFGQGGRKSRRSERLTVTITVDGVDRSMDILVLQPSIADVKAIQALKDDDTKSITEAVIRCAAQPDSRAPLFNEDHRAQLLDQPVNGWVERVALIAFRLAKPEGGADPKGDSKSEETTSSSGA